MVKTILFLLLVMAFSLQGNTPPPRKCELSGSIATFRRISVIPAPGNGIADFAAEEAVRLLKRAGLLVQKTKVPAPGTLSIVLGKHPKFPASAFNFKNVPDGGFIIVKKGRTVCISGTDTPSRSPFRDTSALSFGYSKGTLYGLYEFLERFADIRFYFPGRTGTLVPSKNLRLPANIDILDYPQWEERSYLPWKATGGPWYKGVEEYKKNPAPNLLNSLRLRANTISANLSNALHTGDYVKRFWKTNPEYFAMMPDGRRVPQVRSGDFRAQFCLNSPFEEVLYQDIKAYFEGKPASSRGMKRWGSMFSRRGVNLTHDDAFIWCQCSVCKKIAPADKIYTDPEVRKKVSTAVWQFTCRIASRLKKEKVPNARIIMLAYTPYDIVPDCEIPDNVQVVIVVFPGIQGDCAKQRRNDAVLTAWRKKCRGPVMLRAWPGKYMNRKFPGIPAMHHNLLIDYFTARKNWFSGGFICEGSDRQLFRQLNLYLFFKFAWNPNADLKGIMNEYFTRMFGKGAPYIRQFYDEMEKIWDKELIKESIDDALGGNSRVAGHTETWLSIFGPARIKHFDSLFDRALKAAAKDRASCNRIRFMREQIYAPLRERHTAFSGNVEAQKKWRIYPGKTVWLRQRSSDKTPVQTRIRLDETPQSFKLTFYCEEPEMANMLCQVKGRDKKAWMDSDIEIFFNPSGDRKNYLQWCINANGAMDDICSQKGYQFESGAKTAVIKEKNAWSGTLEIPKKALGNYNKKGFPVFFGRCRVWKENAKKKEVYLWSSDNTLPSFNEVERWGTLDLSGKADANLVKCGTFENEKKILRNTKDYALTFRAREAQSITLDKTTYVSGGQSLLLDCRKPKYMDIQFKLKGVKPRTRYRLSFYCRTENVKGGLSANVYGAGPGLSPMRNARENGTNPWHRRSFILTTGDKVVKTPVLAFGCNGTTGKMWIDNVRFEPVDSEK